MSLSRTNLRNLINSMTPLDPLESTHITEGLAWIDSGAPLYRLEKRDSPPIHLVAYCVVVDVESEKVLLGYHLNAERWLPSGGHIEQDEDPLAAAARECEEELFFQPDFLSTQPLFLTIRETLGPKTPKHTDVSLWYGVQRSPLLPIIFDEREFSEMRWFPFSQLPAANGDPYLDRFLKKLQLHCREHSLTN